MEFSGVTSSRARVLSLLQAAADAFEERGDANFHSLSPPEAVCLAVCLARWRRSPTRTVASGRQKCVCLPAVGLSLTST
jgi:hypothetical protein